MIAGYAENPLGLAMAYPQIPTESRGLMLVAPNTQAYAVVIGEKWPSEAGADLLPQNEILM
jgi:hypothetical protein